MQYQHMMERWAMPVLLDNETLVRGPHQTREPVQRSGRHQTCVVAAVVQYSGGMVVVWWEGDVNASAPKHLAMPKT